MNSKRQWLVAGAAVFSFFLVVLFACGDDKGNGAGNVSGNSSLSNGTLNCSASISVGTMDYHLNGNTLTLTYNGQSSTINRLSGELSSLQGSWSIPYKQTSGSTSIQLTGILKIDKDSISAINTCTSEGRSKTATATTNVQITDTQIIIQQAASSP